MEKGSDESKKSKILTRCLSGVVLLILIILILMADNNSLFYFCLVLSLIGMEEVFNVLNLKNSIFSIISFITIIVYYYFIKDKSTMGNYLLFVTSLIIQLSISVSTYPKHHFVEAIKSFFVIFYPGCLFSFIYLIKLLPDGNVLVWLVFISSWFADAMAYFTGMLFGKHKMTPILSPHKSIEGAIGGILGAGILGYFYIIVIKNFTTVNTTPLICGISCSIAAIISIYGDLAASALKRDTNIKDYGKLIPGHGGIMDRFDSTAFTAPIIYIVVYMINLWK